MSKGSLTALWQRLDRPGHDACLVLPVTDGWRIMGQAAFLDEAGPCQLAYQVDCDGAWQCRSAKVSGWLASRRIEVRISALGTGRWSLNRKEQSPVAGCVDIDLGFTPATNLIPLRRLAIEAGEPVHAPAAWMPFPELHLARLEQSYQRIDTGSYLYRAPGVPYEGVLKVDEAGVVNEYPALWRRVGLPGPQEGTRR